jgi:hypothetical protein
MVMVCIALMRRGYEEHLILCFEDNERGPTNHRQLKHSTGTMMWLTRTEGENLNYSAADAL